MKPITDKNELIALAYLKEGESPRKTSELVGVSYARVLKLRKYLIQAEESDNMQKLFNLDEIHRKELFDAVAQELTPAIDVLATPTELATIETSTVAELDTLVKLETTTAEAASALANRIIVLSTVASTADTVLVLSEALAKIQTSFFASGTQVQINNIGKDNFEKYLQE